MATKKFTSRDFLNQVISGKVDAEGLAHAKEELEKLDKTNEKRKATPTKTSIENAPIADAIITFMETSVANVFLAKDIANAVKQTPQKVTAILTALADDGKVIKMVPTSRSKPIEYKLGEVPDVETVSVLGGDDQ